MNIWAGTSLITTAAWTVNGIPTDPSTITLKFRTGPGPAIIWTVTAGQISRTSPGVYTATIPTTAGDGIIEWIGTGTAAATSVDLFEAIALPL